MAAAAALVSSLVNAQLPTDAVYFGEISLSGVIRPVAQTPARLKEAVKLRLVPFYAAGQDGSRFEVWIRLGGAAGKAGGSLFYYSNNLSDLLVRTGRAEEARRLVEDFARSHPDLSSALESFRPGIIVTTQTTPPPRP